MNTREEVMEAAMLARMVGTHMAHVDHYTVEKTSKPALKINMQNFVAPLLGQQTEQTPLWEGSTAEMRKAYEGVNDLALSKVPDLHIGTFPDVKSVLNNQTTNNIQKPQNYVNIESSSITRSDIDSIRNSLNNISKTMSSILKHMQENQEKTV
jgi:hypothetical protein